MTLSITDKPLSRSGFNLDMVVFVEKGKPVLLRDKSLEQRREPTKYSVDART